MKLLMRADTHVSFALPVDEPKAKCTFSQVIVDFFLIYYFENNFDFLLSKYSFSEKNNNFFKISGARCTISITRFYGCWLLISVYFASFSVDAR